MIKPSMLLWLSNSHGVHIPRLFAKSFVDRATSVEGVSDEDWAALDAGPDHPEYWDAWLEVTDNAVVTNTAGVRYHVYQDGDCWLVPTGMVWDDETETYIWPGD